MRPNHIAIHTNKAPLLWKYSGDRKIKWIPKMVIANETEISSMDVTGGVFQ
jgi:hypothetical protein